MTSLGPFPVKVAGLFLDALPEMQYAHDEWAFRHVYRLVLRDDIGVLFDVRCGINEEMFRDMPRRLAQLIVGMLQRGLDDFWRRLNTPESHGRMYWRTAEQKSGRKRLRKLVRPI